MEILGFLEKRDCPDFQDWKVRLDQRVGMHLRVSRECEANQGIQFLVPLADQDCRDVMDYLD